MRLCRRLLVLPSPRNDTPTLTLIGSPSLTGWNRPFKQGPYFTASSFDDLGPVPASFIQLPHALQHLGRALYLPIFRPDQIAHSPKYSASSKSLFYRRSPDLSDFSFVYVVKSGTGRNPARGKGFALPLCPIVVRFTWGEKKRAWARLRFSRWSSSDEFT